jgi:prolyl 4-hydroxylase
MFSYLVAVLAIVLLYGPVMQLLSTAPPPIRRTPRPQVNETLLAIEDVTNQTLQCPRDSYVVHVFSKAPLVVYIEHFLSADERSHLLQIR